MNDSSSTTRHSFYFWMAVAVAVTAFVGFSRTFFLKLVGRGRVALHRRVGMAGLLLALLFAVSAFAAAISMAHVRGGTHEAIFRLALPFVVAPVFLLLVAGAVLYRHRPQVHRRLMVLAAIEH